MGVQPKGHEYPFGGNLASTLHEFVSVQVIILVRNINIVTNKILVIIAIPL